MSKAVQFSIFFVIVTLALILVYTILKKSFSKNRTIYLNNLEDLSTHYYRYLLYFWGVGIFVPFSELYIDLFSVRAQSELPYYLFVGFCCLTIAFLSNYYIGIRKNLHKLFLLFFSIYNILILYKIATNKGFDYLTLTEFTLVNMISYYVFYKLKYFYFYFGFCSAVLLTLAFSNTISSKEFIIYFNSSFIAFTINFVIHHVDLNIKENLLFAYNYFNKGNQFIVGVNRNGIVTFASKNIDVFFGLKTNDFIGKNWELEVKYKLGFEKNGDDSTVRLKLPDGSLKIIEWQEDSLNHDLVLKIGRNITEIKKSETQIIISNNRLSSLISNIGDLVFVLNLNKVFTEYYQSENDEDLIVPPSFFLGKKINEIGFPDEALNIITDAIDETVKTNKKSYVEYSLPSESGNLWFGVVVSPLCDESGQIKEIICIARNITTHKNDNLELKKTKDVLEQTSQVARMGGWEYDLIKQKIFSSKIAKEIFEVSPEHESNFEEGIDYFEVGINYFEEGNSRNLLLQSITSAINEGTSYDLELPIITAKGNRLWVRAKGASEFSNGVCIRVFGFVQDIDLQVKAKIALEKSEEKFRYISENISDVVIVFEGNKVSYVSPTHEEQFGYSTEEAIAIAENNIFDFFHPDYHDYLDKIYCEALENKTPKLTYVTRFLHKNGTYIWREDSVSLIYDEHGQNIIRLVTGRNINERKNQELTDSLRQDLILKQNNILIKLSKSRLNDGDFWNDSLFKITEAAAEGIDVGRVSFWLFEKDKIECKDLFLKESNTHTISECILEKDFPKYFEGLRGELAIIANDASTHPYTKEFAKEYLKSFNIKSMLDLPISIGEDLIGVICWEHQNEIKNWTEGDVSFAKSIADFISLEIEAYKRLKAENELKRTKEVLEQTSQVAKVGAWEIDVENQTVFFSDINKITLEAPSDFELDLDSALAFFKEGKDRDLVFDSFTLCFKKGVSFDIEVEIITYKGNERWVRALGQSEYENGRSKRLYGTFQDINEQAQLVQIIKDKEQQYRSLLSNISSVTFRCLNDSQWTMIFISDAIEQLSGYPAEEFILNKKRNYIDLVFHEDKNFVKFNSNENLGEYSIEYRIVNKFNEIVWVNEKGRRYYDEIEKRIMLDGIISNITERKHAEIALVKSYEELKNTQSQLISTQLEQEKFVSLVKYSGAMIGMSDFNGKIIFINEEAKHALGYNNLNENLITRDFFTEKSKFSLDNTILPIVFEKGIWQGEQELINLNNGEIIITDSTIFIIRDPQNKKPVAIATIQIDITERKKVESLLIESEERYRFIAENTSDGIFVIENTKIIYTSPSFQKMFGFTFEESHKQSEGDLLDYVHPEDVENFRKNMNYYTGLKYDNFSLQYRTLHKNGHYIWREDTITAFYDGDSVFRFICVVRNISERVKVEQELVEERRLLRAIIDNIPVNVYVKDNSFKKVLSNKTDVQFAGFQDEKSVLGKTDFEIFNNETAKNSYEQDVQVIKSKESIISLETPLVKNDGTETWLLVSKIPLLNEKEEVTGLVGVSVDITERRKSQQLLLESERTLSSILNSLDEVVWAISLPAMKLVLISNSYEKVFGKSSKIWKRKFLLWKEVIIPEDKWIGEQIENDVKEHGQAYGIFRIKDSNGNIKWLENAVKIVRNEQDEPVMIIGTSTDITEKKNSEEALKTAQGLAEEANRSKAELELRALQMQMNPHFVFNALNSIQSYIFDQDTLTANLYLSKFSRLIRLFLDSSSSKFIPLSEEINLLTLYIELEKIRFDNKFEFVIEGSVSKNIEIPTMILQPFVENAINHGLRYKRQKGLLTIRFIKEPNYLICTIEDNGVGRRNAERIQGKSNKGYKSQGLKITTERLITYNKINDANIVFSIRDAIENPNDPNDEVGTFIEIRFPEI